MTEELLKKIEECNKANAEHIRALEIRNEILYEIEPIIRKNFKYSHSNFPGEKFGEYLDLCESTYTNNFWLFANQKNLESNKILSTIYCIRQHKYVKFFINQDYVNISGNDRGFDMIREEFINLCNHPHRDKLLQLLLTDRENADIALAILSNNENQK